MNVEERLKELIIKQYGSIKDFTDHIGIPNSTFANILRRGIMNANVHTIIKVCKALNISTEELAEGKIVPLDQPKQEDPKDIEDLLDDVKNTLLNSSNLTISGVPATPADILSLVNSMEITIEVWKKQTNQIQRLTAYTKKNKKG